MKFSFKLSTTEANKQTISFSIFHLVLLLISSSLILLFPMLWLIVIMPITIVSLVLSVAGFPYIIQKYLAVAKIERLIIPTLQYLKALKVLEFFIKLYTIVFYTEPKVFYYFRNFCYGLTICYMLLGRYYFYHVVILQDKFTLLETTLLGLLLFISFTGSYLRTLINFSMIICISARYYIPEILDPVLRTEPPELPPRINKSFFNFSRTHNHYHPPEMKNMNWGRVGFFVACGGFVVSGAALYYTIVQTEEAKKLTKEAQRQTREAKRQTYEFKRQNDLEELEQKIITREEYDKRHPPK